MKTDAKIFFIVLGLFFLIGAFLEIYEAGAAITFISYAIIFIFVLGATYLFGKSVLENKEIKKNESKIN